MINGITAMPAAVQFGMQAKKKNIVSQSKAESKNDSKKLSTALACLAVVGAAGVGYAIGVKRGMNKNAIKEYPPGVLYTVDDLEKMKEAARIARDSSIEKLTKKLEQLGIKSSDDILKNRKNENFLGSGASSTVYKFSDPELENWVVKIRKNIPEHMFHNQEMRILPDDLAEMNMGQAIAGFGDGIAILRRVTGSPHAIAEWATRGRDNVPYSPKEVKSFLKEVKEISQFPQESFDDYAKKLKLLDDKGYKMDSFNPNNIMVDYETKELSIIDFYKYDKDKGRNSLCDLVAPLVDFKNFGDFYPKLLESSQEEFRLAVSTINKKCLDAAEKQGLDTNKQKYLDFIKDVDSRFGLGDLYYRTFREMDIICSVGVK